MSHYYTVLDSVVHLEPEYTDLYLSPNEELEYNDNFNYKGYFDTTNIMTNLSRTGRLFFVFKFKYADEVLNVVDSN